MSELAAAYPGVETGALVLGPDPRTITALLPSGPDAHRTAGSFILDPDHLNPELAKAKATGLRWIGVWHVHPSGCPQPSDTDWAAAQALLSDPDTDLGGRLLLPISERLESGIVTRFFVADGSPMVIRPINCAIVSEGADPRSLAPMKPRTRVRHGLVRLMRKD
jgi:hypothetical protein